MPGPQRDSQRSGFKHDLRNSVGLISGYSEIILEELEDADELNDEDGNKDSGQ